MVTLLHTIAISLFGVSRCTLLVGVVAWMVAMAKRSLPLGRPTGTLRSP